jgi:hypothetical protein
VSRLVRADLRHTPSFAINDPPEKCRRRVMALQRAAIIIV